MRGKTYRNTYESIAAAICVEVVKYELVRIYTCLEYEYYKNLHVAEIS